MARHRRDSPTTCPPRRRSSSMPRACLTRHARARRRGPPSPARPPLRERLAGRRLVELSLVAGTSSAQAGALPEAVEVTLETQAVPLFGGRFAQLASQIAGWRGEGFRICLVASDERQVEHL